MQNKYKSSENWLDNWCIKIGVIHSYVIFDIQMYHIVQFDIFKSYVFS